MTLPYLYLTYVGTCLHVYYPGKSSPGTISSATVPLQGPAHGAIVLASGSSAERGSSNNCSSGPLVALGRDTQTAANPKRQGMYLCLDQSVCDVMRHIAAHRT